MTYIETYYIDENDIISIIFISQLYTNYVFVKRGCFDTAKPDVSDKVSVKIFSYYDSFRGPVLIGKIHQEIIKWSIEDYLSFRAPYKNYDHHYKENN